MLPQVNRWMEFASAGVDLLLLCRMLGLRLRRIYVFITLFFAVTVFFDAVDLSLAKDSAELKRFAIYSQILMALVFPMTAWDVFEEMVSALGNFRRTAMSRTVTSLIMISIFAIVMANITAGSNDQPGVALFSVVVWTGSATSSLAFIWALHRVIRAQKIVPPHNSAVWILFFELLFGGAVASFFFAVVKITLNQPEQSTIPQVIDLAVTVYMIAITLWCAIKLKAAPKDVPTITLNENP